MVLLISGIEDRNVQPLSIRFESLLIVFAVKYNVILFAKHMKKIYLTLIKKDSTYKKVIDIPENTIKISLNYEGNEIYEKECKIFYDYNDYKYGDIISIIRYDVKNPIVIGIFQRLLVGCRSAALFDLSFNGFSITKGDIHFLKGHNTTSRKATKEEVEYFKEKISNSVYANFYAL